jgi:uncharacterized protein (TIGR02270 family)
MKDELVIWDVVEEHLNEADFLLWQWRRAVFSPGYNLVKLSDTVEPRLFANLEGLYVGSDVVAEALLCPLLEEADSPELTTVAALVMLDFREERMRRRVFDAFETVSEEQQDAIALALQLSPSPYLDNDLRHRLWGPPSREQAQLLSIRTARGLDIAPVPKAFFEDDTTILSVLRALKYTTANGYDGLLEKYAASSHAVARATAVEAGLVRHSQKMWNICLQSISLGDPCHPQYMLLVALLGNNLSHRLLFDRLSDEENREAVLHALGYTGFIESVDQCLPFLRSDNEREAKLAAEAIALIMGINMSDDRFIAEEEGSLAEIDDTSDASETEEDAAAEQEGVRLTLAPVNETEDTLKDSIDQAIEDDAVDELPLPNPSAIETWVDAHKSSFSKGQRYLLGKEWCVQTHVEALESTSMRRRHPLALKLFIESGGADRVSTWAFSFRQQRQLKALVGLKNSNIKDRSRFWL